MSLENLQLPAIIIGDLYKKCIVNIEPVLQLTTTSVPVQINFLGGNASHITLIVDQPNATYIADDELSFLTGILTACNLTIGDIALINLNKRPAINYKDISAELMSETIILFGVLPEKISLPLHFPPFQIQRYNEQRYLQVPGLAILKEDRELKKQLWIALKTLFSIP